jgi:dTDP-4-dehydrorhamnose 3,5-epimerase
MKFHETPLRGAFILEIERLEDERGHFARTWCREELAARGLDPTVAQCSVSYNRRARTMRGLHYQAPPFPEAKVVTCQRGRAFDVIVDLRRASATFRKWFAVELAAYDGRSLYVPEGFAHGFMTLEDDTTLHYQISETYHPELSRGVLWNDPAFGIHWPFDTGLVLSARDRAYPSFDPEGDGFATGAQA